MSLHDVAVPPLRLRLRHAMDEPTEKLALKAALTAAHLLGLAAGAFLRQLRGTADPLAQAAARIREAEIKAALAWDIVELLRARLCKIPDRHRPYYTPAQRFRILEIKSLLGWSRDLAARVFAPAGVVALSGGRARSIDVLTATNLIVKIALIHPDRKERATL